MFSDCNDYGNFEYWDRRYNRNSEPFDYITDYDTLFEFFDE